MLHLKEWRRATERGQEKPLPLHLQILSRQRMQRAPRPDRLVATQKWTERFLNMEREDFERGKHLLRKAYPGMWVCDASNSFGWVMYTYDLSKAAAWKKAALLKYAETVTIHQLTTTESASCQSKE